MIKTREDDCWQKKTSGQFSVVSRDSRGTADIQTIHDFKLLLLLSYMLIWWYLKSSTASRLTQSAKEDHIIRLKAPEQ